MGFTGPGQRSLVLIIEDDRAIATLLAEVVREMVGAESLTVPHPERAPRDREIDLVVTDLVGDESYRAEAGGGYLARLRARFSDIPIILLTGQPWARDAAHPLPVDQIVTKPFDLDDLVDRMRSLLPAADRTAA